jgi:molecular chaperone DnaK (HSP70)
MFLENEKPQTIAFVDFGHSKSSLTFIKFTRENFEIVGHYSDRNLGVRNID